MVEIYSAKLGGSFCGKRQTGKAGNAFYLCFMWGLLLVVVTFCAMSKRARVRKGFYVGGIREH